MSGKKWHRRFGIIFVIQHMILLISVLLLIISGVPLKFPDQAWAHWVIWLQGGMAARAVIHHTAGQVLMALGVFHFVYYIIFERKPVFFRRPILINPTDLKNIWQHLLYLVGRRGDIPPMGRYTWFEKLDYVGVIWGIAVMGITGMTMLYMEFALKFISMSWLQVLWAAHSEEAMLATMFLLVIHMYNVHFNPERFPMSLTWINGKISMEEMEKYHPLELEELVAQGLISPEDQHGGSPDEPAGDREKQEQPARPGAMGTLEDGNA
ncbi:MAG: cytochrome b/b6 domain-containing protein [Deltaproteobacteria bacterium]|nr:cytochrome b/b6 domain-containing protein [Deltaproteobacteria bacterium]